MLGGVTHGVLAEAAIPVLTRPALAVKLVRRHFVFLETDRETPLVRAKRGAGKDLRTQP